MSRSTSSKKSQTPKSRTDVTPKKGTTTHGYTMLMIRVEEGSLPDVKAALKQYPEEGINEQNKHGQTALSLGARNGNAEICEFLINEGADVNLPNKSGQTPLFIACSYNHFDIANLLLYRGAHVNTADSRGWTPLMSACQNSNLRLVELLLTYKADITPIDRFGKRARERTKDPKITKILDEMERRLEMLEEAAKYNTPRKKTSRSRSRGSQSKRTHKEGEEEEEDQQNEEELYDSKHLDSTLRACPQFVSDMEIYKMHKRAGYYKYHKAGDPRNLHPASAASLRRRTEGSFDTTTYDRNFNSALKSPFNNDLLSCITRGRPLTGRTGTPKLNESKLSNPLKDENHRRTKSGSAKRENKLTKSFGSPVLNQISESFIENMKKFSQSKEANPFKKNADSIVKTVKKPRRSLLEVFEDEVTDSEGEEDTEDVMNDELKALYALFVKKLSKRTEKKLNKRVTFMIDKETRENDGEHISQERREQIISEKGAELEGKTVSDFNKLLEDLLNCYKLGDSLAQTVKEGTETIINRVTALAQHNLMMMQDSASQRDIDFKTPSPALMELQKAPLPISNEALPAFLEERMTEKLKGELYNKLDEIFEVLDEALINKPEDQQSQLTLNFRSKALKTLNKLRIDLLQDLLMKAPSMSELQDYRSSQDDLDHVSTTSLEKGIPLIKLGSRDASSSPKNDVEKVKEEIYDKLDELFKILDEACFNKPEGEKAQFLNNFRSEVIKALNKVRAGFVDELLTGSLTPSPFSSPMKNAVEVEGKEEAKIFIIEAPSESEGAYTKKLREEVNKKMGDIFEVLDVAIAGKTEEEREACLKDFRSEALKNLNRLKVYLLNDLLLKTPTVQFEKISQDDSKEFLEDLQRKKSARSAQLKSLLEMPEKQKNSSENSGNFRYGSTALNSIDIGAEEMPNSLLVQPNPFLSDTLNGGHRSSPVAGKESTNTLVLVDEELIRGAPRSNSRYESKEEEDGLEEADLNIIEKTNESDNEITAVKDHKKGSEDESLNELNMDTDTDVEAENGKTITACKTGDNVYPTMNTELDVASSEVLRKQSNEIAGEVFEPVVFAEACHAGDLENDVASPAQVADTDLAEEKVMGNTSNGALEEEVEEEPLEFGLKPVAVEEADHNEEGSVELAEVKFEENMKKIDEVSLIQESSAADISSNQIEMKLTENNSGNTDNLENQDKIADEAFAIAKSCLEMIMAGVEACIDNEKLFQKNDEVNRFGTEQATEEELSQDLIKPVVQAEDNQAMVSTCVDSEKSFQMSVDMRRIIVQTPSGNAGELESDDEDSLLKQQKEEKEVSKDISEDERPLSSRSNGQIQVMTNAGELENDIDDDEIPEAAVRLIADIKSEIVEKLDTENEDEQNKDNSYQYEYSQSAKLEDGEGLIGVEIEHGAYNTDKAHAEDLEKTEEIINNGANDDSQNQMTIYDYLEGIIAKIEDQEAARIHGESTLKGTEELSSEGVTENSTPTTNMKSDMAEIPVKDVSAAIRAGDLESDKESISDAEKIENGKETLIFPAGLAVATLNNNNENTPSESIKEPAEVIVNASLHAGDLESDKERSATENFESNTKKSAIYVENEEDFTDEDLDEKVSSDGRRSQNFRSREEDDEVYLGESQATKRFDTDNKNSDVFIREVAIEDSDFMAQRRREIHEAEIGRIIDDVQTIASEVIYNRPSDLSDVTSFRRGDTITTHREGVLERTETRESEVLYRFDDDHSAQLQDKYKMLDVIEDPMERQFSGYESVVRFEGLDADKYGMNNSYANVGYIGEEGSAEVRYEKTDEDQQEVIRGEEEEKAASDFIKVQDYAEEISSKISNNSQGGENRRESLRRKVQELIMNVTEERARDKIFENQHRVGVEGKANPVRLSIGSPKRGDFSEEIIKEEGEVHSVPASLKGLNKELAQENKVTFKGMNSQEGSFEEFDANKENRTNNIASDARTINKVAPESMGRLTVHRRTVTETVKAYNSRFSHIIPKPAPSRTIKDIKVMRIDEIPYCENFHYLGQSKNKPALLMSLPKKDLKQTIIGNEEMTFEKAKEF